MKPCGHCKRELPLDEFGICRARADGRNLYCKSCIRDKVAENRKRLKEYKQAKKALVVQLSPERKPSILWRPTARDKVKQAIAEGCRTWIEIKRHARIRDDDVMSDAIAELMLDRKEIKCVSGEVRRYFLAA